MLLAGAAVEAVLYVLALTGVLGNWWFVALTVLLFAYLPTVAHRLMPEVVDGGQAHAPEPLPLERIGLDGTYTDEQRDEVDRALGLPRHHRPPVVPAPVAVPVPAPVTQETARVTA